jgi:hypothetical protein
MMVNIEVVLEYFNFDLENRAMNSSQFLVSFSPHNLYNGLRKFEVFESDFELTISASERIEVVYVMFYNMNYPYFSPPSVHSHMMLMIVRNTLAL